MADATPVHNRRQPPSPLVFSPDAILSPIPLQAQQSVAFAPNTHSGSSASNTVSMPFVRRHVTRRLKAAKTECDKELQRVTNNITAFFEERLREGDHETERDRREREYDSQHSDFDDYNSDGGYDLEPEFSRHGRHLSTSGQMSPVSRRQSGTPWERPLGTSVSSSALTSSSPASSTIMLPDAPITRKQPTPQQGPAPSSWGSSSASRRLSRTIHIPIRPTRSGQSSRSTSRSRSPLPPLSSHTSFSDYALSSSGLNQRSSRILVDDPVDPIMAALYEIIGVATDVTDMTVAQLTAQPKLMETIVQRVQNIGRTWDDHPDWHGRNWYVQVLLAVASLSRVVEWWEAEKQFWNFDENEDEQDEPLMFVTKPVEDAESHLLSPPLQRVESGLEGFMLNEPDDQHPKLVPTRPATPPTVRKPSYEAPKTVESSRLGLPEPIPKPVPAPSPSKLHDAAESARVLATERLRLQAETAQNQNIVVELSLDGDHFIWVNHAWRVVVGTDPDGLPGTRISSLLSQADWGVFKAATQRLQDDDSHTVEVRFKLQVEPTVESDPNAGVLYQQMEGKGMLMIDREDGQPSHTMWVVKPIAPPRYENDVPYLVLEANDLAPEPASSVQPTFPLQRHLTAEELPTKASLEEPATPLPFTVPISVEPILCRICECSIPSWYFEKHSETCVETHRLEAEIVECNESIAELRNTIRDLCVAVDRPSPAAVPEYRGMQIFTPATSPGVSSPLQLFRANKMQRLGVKKMQRRLLDQIDEILQVAADIEMPSLKDEEAQEPIERQRLLSPGSERKISQIRQWSKPTTEDAALGQLLEDAQRVMRQKIDNVVRMQNTIRYSEKIFHEWQERVEGVIAAATEEDSGSGSESGSEEGKAGAEPEAEQDANDASSIRSEYGGGSVAVGGTVAQTKVPAQLPTTTTTAPTPVVSTLSPSYIFGTHIRPPQQTQANIPSNLRGQQLHPTRSSTPSSVSSPLALAAPIIAPSSPEESMPLMLLDDGSPGQSYTGLKNPTRDREREHERGGSPGSGSSLTRDGSVKRKHRRNSTAASMLLTSPPVAGPLSPRLVGTQVPLPRTQPTSIRDFDIIKPISKGAFGSVFLAKKKVTGDYYAIKVLKKADMIAKNQITNVKAERMILMKQAESPFVAKLYFTFQSKDNLYLVMEYLNGGDCAALIKSLGSLPEEWTKNYIAEVVLGLEYLHQRNVVHRDLKPDNLLIDSHGHLKLTDFGLSRIGLLGRQTRESRLGRSYGRSRPPSMDSAYLASPLIHPDNSGSYFTQRTNVVPRAGNSPYQYPTDDVSESSGSESVSGLHARRSIKLAESPLQSFATELTTDLRSHSNSVSGGTPPGEQKFVGTPDYLAPETILGLRGDDAAVDWWALGVITYEFLYGIPPFHADSPEKVFENILSGHIDWHDEWVDFSQEARDFMKALMTLDPNERLGAGGAEEVKNHPFFAGIDWEKVTTTEAAFIPQVDDPESTDYFDPRGAIPQLFHDDDQILQGTVPDSPSSVASSMPPPSQPLPISGRSDTPLSGGSDDFGSFSFKNVPVLKQANDDVIRKLKTDQMAPISHALTEPILHHHRSRSVSQRIKKPPSVVTTMEPRIPAGPPSPATSTSSMASSPSRSSLPLTPSSVGHVRKPSEYGAVERFKLNHGEGVDRRNTMPSRLRTASVSSVGDGSGSETWHSVGYGSQQESNTPPSSVHSIDLRKGPDPSDRVVTCMLAEDNPITAKIIETLLIRLGCRCVVVADGSEAISVAMGDIKFDCILMDLQMPVLDGEGAARYIKSTNGKNTNTPIIAVSAYSGVDPVDGSNLFTASLAKPLQKADLIAVMRQLGFKTSPIQGGAHHPKVTTSHHQPQPQSQPVPVPT